MIIPCFKVRFLGDLFGFMLLNRYVGTGTAAQSPFVIAIERAGVQGTDC